MTTEKSEVETLVDELMKENDGCNPNCPIPIDQQLASQRAKYRKQLDMVPLKERITLAAETLLAELPSRMGQAESEAIIDELRKAAELMTTDTKEFGVSQKTLDTLFQIGYEKIEAKNTTCAAAIFALLCMIAPTWYRNWYARGICEQEAKAYPEAIEAYEMAARIDETSPEPHLQLAACFAEKGEVQQAKQHLETAKGLLGQYLEPRAEWSAALAELEQSWKNKF